MNYARINRAIAVAEAKQAEEAEQAERVRAAREAERVESNRERPQPPDLSGGLDPLGIGDDGPSELSEWYRSISGAASRESGSASIYYPSTRR